MYSWSYTARPASYSSRLFCVRVHFVTDTKLVGVTSYPEASGSGRKEPPVAMAPGLMPPMPQWGRYFR
ncbi:MAG: hypothetical protein DMF96_17795 [Acidobacteria bacterium]|nr:MAG: hypothetical protein DMF96_17795 [Acidobacteriota bacterium]